MTGNPARRLMSDGAVVLASSDVRRRARQRCRCPLTPEHPLPREPCLEPNGGTAAVAPGYWLAGGLTTVVEGHPPPTKPSHPSRG